MRHSARRERLKYQASPDAMVFCKASAFMCATISTSPDLASVATQVTSPSASNFGVKARPSSASWAEEALANGDGLSAKSAILRGSAIGPAHHRNKAHLVVRVSRKLPVNWVVMVDVMKRTCSSGLSRKLPVNWVVMVEEPGFSTPRTDMHMCSASSMTATPRGVRISSSAVAICEVICSWVCSRRA